MNEYMYMDAHGRDDDLPIPVYPKCGVLNIHHHSLFNKSFKIGLPLESAS
jgi:hypothetical protein